MLCWCCELEAANQATNDVNNAMAASHSHLGGKLLKVAPTLLLFSLGFVLGMVSNSKFPSLYLSSISRSPSPAPPPLAPAPPPLPQQNPEVGMARFLEPRSVTHNMTDEELLWWASMTPKVRSTPYHRAPKVAFLFLARGDLPLRPLWEKFFAGHQGLYSIYVHTDPSYAGSPPEDSVFYGRMIPSQVN